MHFQSYSNAGARVLFGAQEGSYYVEIHERPGNGRAPINGKSIEQLRIRLAALLQQLGDIGGELDLSLDQGLVVVRAAVPTYTASILPE